jgi:hypothetical protein
MSKVLVADRLTKLPRFREKLLPAMPSVRDFERGGQHYDSYR